MSRVSTLEVAQLINLPPEAAAALIQRGCWASTLQGDGSSGLGESSGPQPTKQRRHHFFGCGNWGDDVHHPSAVPSYLYLLH